MSKRASEQTVTTRTSYVQSNILFGLGGGIQLQDLRDIVAATKDYSRYSRVILERQKVTVVEKSDNGWSRKGEDDE
jgi:hypothetical protein